MLRYAENEAGLIELEVFDGNVKLLAFRWKLRPLASSFFSSP